MGLFVTLTPLFPRLVSAWMGSLFSITILLIEAEQGRKAKLVFRVCRRVIYRKLEMTALILFFRTVIRAVGPLVSGRIPSVNLPVVLSLWVWTALSLYVMALPLSALMATAGVGVGGGARVVVVAVASVIVMVVVRWWSRATGGRF